MSRDCKLVDFSQNSCFKERLCCLQGTRLGICKEESSETLYDITRSGHMEGLCIVVLERMRGSGMTGMTKYREDEFSERIALSKKTFVRE